MGKTAQCPRAGEINSDLTGSSFSESPGRVYSPVAEPDRTPGELNLIHCLNFADYHSRNYSAGCPGLHSSGRSLLAVILHCCQRYIGYLSTGYSVGYRIWHKYATHQIHS